MVGGEHSFDDPSVVVDMAAFKAAKGSEQPDPIEEFLSRYDHLPVDDAEAAADDRPSYTPPTDEEVAKAVARSIYTLGLGDSPPLSPEEEALLESAGLNTNDSKRYPFFREAVRQLSASRDAKRLAEQPADE